jgi:hypothetical protein
VTTLQGGHEREDAQEHIMSGRLNAVAAVLSILGWLAAPAHARDDWQGELTPYLWAAGTDTDVTVDSQTARVKREFREVALAGSVLGVAQRNTFVIWTQLDFLRLDTDELERPPAGGTLETDASFVTVGFGHQFGEPSGITVDVLFGARHVALDSKLTLNAVGRVERDRDFTDPVLIVRPSWPFAERWRFNPTVSIGGGADSDLTWELQPQIQYWIIENFALRFGYRYVFYKIESADKRNAWDGAFQGLILGVGGFFGGRDKRVSPWTPSVPGH